ncbi:hypothetical protein ANO14919_066840 [Xylariales sp. No.14919]|nr:hypothetical protein ANO14919_066840 [Xylariales sp. No.14919]
MPAGSTPVNGGGPGGNQPLQTLTVTIPGEEGPGGSRGPQTLTITIPSGSPGGETGGPGSGQSQPLQTLTVTLPATHSELEGEPHTITITASGGSPSNSNFPGSGSQGTSSCDENESGSPTGRPWSPSQTAGIPGGQGGQPGAPSSGPWPSQTAGNQGGQPGSPSNGPWSPSQPGGQGGQPGSPSSNPWPISGNPGGPIAGTSPCSTTGPGASGVLSPSNTGGSPFPVITLTLSELPLQPSNAGNGGSSFPWATQSNPANPTGASGPTSAGQSSPSGGQGNPSSGFSEPPINPTASGGSGAQTEPSPSGGYGAPFVSESTLFPSQGSENTGANSNVGPSTTPAPSSSGAPGAIGSSSPSPVSAGPSRGPFSSVPSSGWNFSTSASQEGPASESTSSPAPGNPSDTTSCTDSTARPRESASTPLSPSFPPPVSPALTSPSEAAATATSPSTSGPAGGSGPETPVGCLSMTTMVISTMTFSWCAQVASSTPAVASPTGQASIQNAGSTTTNSLSPSPAPGGYEFGSASIGRRSPATIDILSDPVVQVPSTLSTIILSSRSKENVFTPIETSNCGGPTNQGSFIQNFDDLPPQSPGPKGNPKPMPIFTPYHRFYYSGGFTVLPPPAARFKPSSGNLMLQFTPSSISNTSEPGVPPDTADISVGPQQLATCFSFNFTSVSLGCDSVVPCSFKFTGFRYDRFRKGPVEVTSQVASVPACTETENCALTPIAFSGFNELTSVTIKAQTNGKPTAWWADDFAFGWFDNSCEAGMCRSMIPNGITKPSWSVTGRQAASKLLGLMGVRRW